MATIAPPTPLVLKHVLLTIAADDFQKHVSAVTFTPSASQVTWKGLAPDAVFTDVTTAAWSLGLELVQDWSSPVSLCRYLYDNEGKRVAAKFRPRNAEGPSFTSNIVITPGAIGGAIDQVGTQSVTLGCDKPTLVPAFAVTNKALASNVATLTTSTPHGYIVGDSILVAGVDATFDGTYTLTAVTTNTLSYAKTAANVSSTAATGTVSKA